MSHTGRGCGGCRGLLGPGGVPRGAYAESGSQQDRCNLETDSEHSETLPGLKPTRSALEMAFDCAKVIPPHMRRKMDLETLASHWTLFQAPWSLQAESQESWGCVVSHF